MARQRRTRREHLEEQPSATISLPPARQSRSCCSCQKGSIGWDIVIIIFVVFTASAYIFLHIYFHHLLEKLPPIQGPEYDPTKWGTYRSHMFFGLRTRSPKSPLFGMMWYEQPEVVIRPNIYHWANQGDVERYGWYEADGRSFGKQNITTKSGIVQTDWVNDDRGGFTSRIRFNMAKGKRYNVIFYLSSPVYYF